MGQRPLTDLAIEMLSWLPTALRSAPEYESLMHVQAKEVERVESFIEHVRGQFFVQRADELGLPFWEDLVRRGASTGTEVAVRRAALMAALGPAGGGGLAWEVAVSALIGNGWSYVEHDPDDPATPDEYTILVRVPFAPGSALFRQASRFLREVTPANTDIIVSSIEGFLLDQSQLDQEALNP